MIVEAEIHRQSGREDQEHDGAPQTQAEGVAGREGGKQL